MSKRLTALYQQEGPHGMSYEELLILVLGDESVEEIKFFVKKYKWHEIKEIIRSEETQIPGIRESTIVRLRAMLAVSVALQN